jgi:PKD repeat protein
MKIILFFLLFIVTGFLYPVSAYANGAGLPAFFKINGTLAVSNPLQQFGITASSFLIPQDLAPENYILKEPIQFEIDQTPLQSVIPPELLKKTTYTWDFGDGIKAEGLHNTHTYNKIGSYILILTINIYEEGATNPTKFVDSFLINVIPHKEYKDLPKSVILLNNKQINGTKNTFEDLNFSNQVTLDASQSKSSSKITQYLWNLGDGQTSTQPIVTHKYKKDTYFQTVVLRVKDSNGFISDTFVGIRNNSEDPAEKKKSTYGLITGGAIGIALITFVIVMMITLKKNSRKK